MDNLQDLTSGIQSQLTEKLLELFDDILKERALFYTLNTKPGAEQIPAIIASYCNQNVIISETIGAVAGPMGIVASIPESIRVIQNQVKMVCDIAYALNQQEKLNNDFLTKIILSTLGYAAAGFIAIEGGKLLIKKVSPPVYKKVANTFGFTANNDYLQIFNDKWLPMVGGIAMGFWVKYSTSKVAQQALIMLESNVDETQIKTTSSAQTTPINSTDEIKIQSLINLLKVSNCNYQQESKLIENMIADANLDLKTKDALFHQLDEPETALEINFSSINHHQDSCFALIAELISFAKRNDNLDSNEIEFIIKTGTKMGLSERTMRLLLNK